MWNVDVGPAPGQKKMVDYVIATGAVGVAALVVHWMSAYFLPTQTPAPVSVSVFFCAILLSAWRGGWPGGLAFLLSLTSLYYFFRQPSGGLQLATRDEIRLAYFALVGLGITALGAAKGTALKAAWSAIDDLAEAVLKLKRINQKLESEGAERELIYKKLRFSEALLTEGQRISRTGSWLLNSASNKLLWSDEHYRIFGYEPDVGEATFRMASQRIHAEDRERVSHIVREAMRASARFECEYRIVLPGGELRHIKAAGYPAQSVHVGHGEYIGISVDITEQRQAEELLRRSEREFRTLAENSPDSVIRYDLDCRRIYVNPAYERTRGVPANTMLHRPLSYNWHWDIAVDEYITRLRRIIDTGEPDQMFGIWRSPGNKALHCAVQAVAERDASGAVVSVLAIIRDVTSIKQAELRLEESQTLLRQLANRSETVREEERKHLARELHDDLAQYLLALRMKISLLDFDFGLGQPSQAQGTAGMIALVDSSIAVVRNIVTSLRPAALDMGIVSALEWLVQEFAAQTGIDCRLDSRVTSVRIHEASAVAFFRIAQEALRNVARHAGASRVDIGFRRLDACYLLEVSDNGVGFDAAFKKPASFGLVGMQERALMLSGRVDICTAPHAGTSIQVYIPVHTFPPEE
jgi:PAS domain S-box-containing protein